MGATLASLALLLLKHIDAVDLPRKLLALLFGGTAIAAWLTTHSAIGLAFLPFVALGLYLVLECHRQRFEVAPGGLVYRTLFKQGRAGWDEVRRIDWSPVNKWFRLTLTDGTLVRMSGLLVGMPEAAPVMLAAVDPGRIDPQARQVLEQSAAGKPPRLT